MKNNDIDNDSLTLIIDLLISPCIAHFEQKDTSTVLYDSEQFANFAS